MSEACACPICARTFVKRREVEYHLENIHHSRPRLLPTGEFEYDVPYKSYESDYNYEKYEPANYDKYELYGRKWADAKDGWTRMAMRQTFDRMLAEQRIKDRSPTFMIEEEP